MSKGACAMVPEVPGTRRDSELYRELLIKKRIDRPIVNWIYTYYICSNMAAKMDAAGMTKRDSNGQHKAEDVLKFINFTKMQNEFVKLSDIEKSRGYVDSSGVRKVYTDAEAALKEADAFNSTYSGIVANVYKVGDSEYNIVVAQKNSKTHTRSLEVKSRLRAWETYKQYFRALGIDLETLTFPPEIANSFSAYNYELVSELLNIKNTNPKYIYRRDALKLFCLYANSPEVQALLGRGAFASLEKAAQAIDDINHGRDIYTPHQKTLLNTALTYCKSFPRVDFNALRNQVQNDIQMVISSDDEESIRKELHNLNQKYGIQTAEVNRTLDEIKTLSEASAEAAFIIQRKIRKMEREEGMSAESNKYDYLLSEMMGDMAAKKYCSSLFRFLAEAANLVTEIDNIIAAPLPAGTNLEVLLEKTKRLQLVKQIINQYMPLVVALSNDKLSMDESISTTDATALRDAAKKIKEYLEKKQEEVLVDQVEGCVLDTMQELVGETAPSGYPIANAVMMGAADSSLMDRFLYSMGTASDPMVAAIGKIIKTAQVERGQELNSFDARITAATKKLHKAGHDSKFMYIDGYHIRCDRDWFKYEEALGNYKASLYSRGLTKAERKAAERAWIEANTEERVVDEKTGRTERVPNAKYKYPGMWWNARTNKMESDLDVRGVPFFTDAQMEYYNTMMQIKGEIGTMLPAKYRFQYRPPQIRRGFLDAITSARSFRDFYRAFVNKFLDLVTVREDNADYQENGIINGEEVEFAESNAEGKPIRVIPIFYVNKLKDGMETLREFSTGLQHLAGTAVNYKAMNKVVDAVEFLSEFASLRAEVGGNYPKADMIKEWQLLITKKLNDYGKATNTSAMLNSFIMYHIYGVKKDPKEKKWARYLLDKIIGYTSFKGLSTNIKGWVNNALVAEWQILIEAGAGEFYGLKNYARAHKKLFGATGVLMDTLMETKKTEASLLSEIFDPMLENYSSKSHKRYHKSFIRKTLGRDLSFIGYGMGEFIGHYVNMYAVLDHEEVYIMEGGRRKKIHLLDAFETTKSVDGVATISLKAGVMDKDGNAITLDSAYIEKVRKKIEYCNVSCHGALDDTNKGLIHQYWWGAMVMNFRQWMVGHYSRRFRGRYYDAVLSEEREGYWTTMKKYFNNETIKDTWSNEGKLKAIGMVMADLWRFEIRAMSKYGDLDDMQKYNVKRARRELNMFFLLVLFSFALGDPDDHEGEAAYRFLLYQVKRLIMEELGSMPTPAIIPTAIELLNSPAASIATLKALWYLIGGGLLDINEEIESGPHMGENKYWRNVKKYLLPFTKDIEQMQELDDDDAIFTVFQMKLYR